ncbi:MAG: bifunctional 4-hydroxy-2-oxoglutarate aldolase/2-dehydro-3-deoxy-phosphogluconate aldolase [Verrucomicrobiales bacterium]
MKSDLPVAERICQRGVVAVLMIDRVEDAVPVARALLDGGVDVMELTLRTDAAMDSLRAVKAEVPEMLAGVGTILTPAQAKDVYEAGADFGVAPGVNPRVVEAAQGLGLPFAPGIMTPSDIEAAVELDCQILKFFPASSSGGLKHLNNIAAPYQHLGLRYIPLGGINQSNMGDYLSSQLIAAIGGSWLASKGLIAAQDWDGITENARAAMASVGQARA